jgi:hypothetical protein
VREFDRHYGWGRGFTSCAAWLSWRTGIAPVAAREKVRVARALADLPLLSDAMRLGQLSYAKARALTRIATSSNEERLLELARVATAAQLEKVVRAWRRVDRNEEREHDSERHASRHLTLYRDEDGSYVLRARLDPEVGALLERALDTASFELWRRDSGVDATCPTRAAHTTRATRAARARATRAPDDDARVPQRRADAIGLVVECALRNGIASVSDAAALDATTVAFARDGDAGGARDGEPGGARDGEAGVDHDGHADECNVAANDPDRIRRQCTCA